MRSGLTTLTKYIHFLVQQVFTLAFIAFQATASHPGEQKGERTEQNSLVFTEFIFYQNQEEEEGMAEEDTSRHT